MSQENVEIVKQGFDAYLRGDVSAAISHHDDEVVFNPAEEAPIQGREAVLAYIRRWEEPWEDYEAEAEEFIDAGDQVVVTLHVKGRGQGSGVEVDARSYQVHVLRDGKLIRMDEYLKRETALEAAGLSE
jgi:ketosteroid isomerase-like protein